MGRLNLTIWITTICNFYCTYCYEITYKELVMSKINVKKTVKFVIQYMKNMNIKHCNIHFHGGEPLLYPNIIWDFIKEFKQYINYDFEYSITTNGTIYSTIIEEHLLNEINSVSFSIDGSQYTFDLCRRAKDNKDYYTTIITNAKSLLKQKKNVKVRMTIVPENVAYLFKNIQYFIKIGFKYINYAIDYTNPNWTEDTFKQYYLQLLELRKYVKENNLYSLSIDGCKNINFSDKGKCQGGVYSLNIYPDATIYPCTIVAGNDLYQIGDIENGINNNWINTLDFINNLHMDDCHGCSLIKSCFSNRCRLFNKILTGSYQKPSANICATQNIMFQLYTQQFKGNCNE